MRFLARMVVVSFTLPGSAPAVGQPEAAAPLFDRGRLLATGGVSTVEGAGGGGLVPWALITGYATRDGVGVTGFGTAVVARDMNLYVAGAGIGLFDRVELTYARQWFDTRGVGAKLGLGQGYTFEQDVVGAKLRLLGDAVYAQDSWLPQLSLGAQYKINHQESLVRALGAARAQDAEFYLAASKLLLEHSVLLNGTVRLTRANQFGLLGFGGDRGDRYQPQFEGSVVWLASRDLAFGAEYRTKPDNLSFAKEGDAWDLFVAWFPSKHASVTLAYVDLGPIAGQRTQNGVYLSLQVGF
jgi:hypothetical protein